MKKRWFTSDPHYGHKNVIRYCNRPFSGIAEMERVLIENWNAVVGPQDEVYVIGDVFFCGMARAKEILAKLNGYKILIRGNHDRGAEKMKEIGFDEVHDKLELEIDGKKVKLCHFPYKPFMGDIPDYVQNTIEGVKKAQRASGMDSSGKLDELISGYVSAGVLTISQGQRLTHYDLRFFDRRVENEGGVLLCGHVHEKWATKDRMINVGVDVRNFTPMSEEQVIAVMNELP